VIDFVDTTMDLATKKILHLQKESLRLIKSQAKLNKTLHATLQTLINVFKATYQMQPVYTASEHAYHEEQFKNDSVLRYHSKSPTSPDYIRCSVLGEFIYRDAVQAVHLCNLEFTTALPMLGKDFSYVWSPENCVLMYEPFQKMYNAMDITLLYHPERHQITLQVLFDDLLSKSVVGDFTLIEGWD
jgi:hypothetical protein